MEKKYKLYDLISNGSNARKEVNPTVIVSDGEYPKGTILDANSILSKISLTDTILESVYTKEQVDSKIENAIDNIIDGATDAMDTLKELEDAILNNKDVIDSFDDIVNNKVDKSQIADMATKSWVDSRQYATQTWVEDKGYLTEHQDISGLATKKEVEDFEKEVEDTYTKQEGTYPDFVAGNAANLQGNNEIVSSSAYHPTGGNEDVLFGTAQIENIKGNAVAWNQLAPMITDDNFKVYNESNAVSSVNNGVCNVTVTNYENTSFNIGVCYYPKSSLHVIKEHIYLICAEIYTSNSGEFAVELNNYYTTLRPIISENKWTKVSTIVKSAGTLTSLIFSKLSAFTEENNTYSIRNIQLFDLTLIYGAGNEPSTAEQFEADYQRWFGKPLEYEEYDEGSIRPVLATGIKTVGFNLSKVSEFEGSTGDWYKNGTNILFKNDIGYTGQFMCSMYVDKDSPDSTAEYESTGARFLFVYTDGTTYSGSGRVGIGKFERLSEPGKIVKEIITTYGRAGIIKFHDICIHFVWSGKRNGEYEPYWEETQQLPITSLTSGGKVIFPDGLKRAGDVYDEIFVENGVTKAVKRVGSVDLWTLNWEGTGNTRFNAPIIGGVYDSWKYGKNNVICPIYNTKYVEIGSEFDNAIGITEGRFFAKDSRYTDANSFKESLQGVIAYYELAEPETYIIDNFNLPVVYKIDDFGTEQILMPENSITPIVTSRYGINAVDAIRNLSRNYLGKKETAVAANKLYHPRKIWGKTFDGTEDVSGVFVNTIKTIDDISQVHTDVNLCVVNTSQSGTFGLYSTMTAGTELQVFINNTGSDSITITIPDTFKHNGTISIDIPAGNYGEINVISDGTNLYLRAV